MTKTFALTTAALIALAAPAIAGAHLPDTANEATDELPSPDNGKNPGSSIEGAATDALLNTAAGGAANAIQKGDGRGKPE